MFNCDEDVFNPNLFRDEETKGESRSILSPWTCNLLLLRFCFRNDDPIIRVVGFNDEEQMVATDRARRECQPSLVNIKIILFNRQQQPLHSKASANSNKT